MGRGTQIRGRVTGTGDLEIAGRVDGDVACSGEVTVESGGLVGAGISARRIVVRGAVKGDLVAEEALVLEQGARVVGDLKAPRIAIAPGGLVRGHVQTGAAGASRPRAVAASRATPAVTKPAAKAPPPAAKKAPPPPPAKKTAAAKPHRGAALAGARPGPPPPVVPALKKGTKATQKKR
ncbi:MAG: polymer-forming cytoskeletal protein [Labilithrix sp.]|nr:polymer-forming cytoskeletal protein [Labilithrix sp.]